MPISSGVLPFETHLAFSTPSSATISAAAATACSA